MMNEQDIEILKTSTEPRELKKLANKLAASDNREELRVLLQFLDDPDFLGRLDAPEDYEMSYSGLRLASVINVLMKNRAELAGQAIVYLINAGHFCGHLLRIQFVSEFFQLAWFHGGFQDLNILFVHHLYPRISLSITLFSS